ncbi:MAG: TIGR00730 family Rossman fold protein [Alphaproteobacteria bacterium]|nr:TIGR00730 family Rossman fold protein [Alphaproteobacteria bacterium]
MAKVPNGIELAAGADAFAADLKNTKDLFLKVYDIVAIFGGSGISRDSEYYVAAERLANILAGHGVSIITGGGPGIMEAGNKGAQRAGTHAKSYGLQVSAIKEEIIDGADSFIDSGCCYNYKTLSVRLLTLISSADAIVFFPGGYGTFEELFCLLVRIKVGMLDAVPIYLYGSKFWKGLVDWLKSTVVCEGVINAEHIDFVNVEDDVEKIASDLVKFISQKK